ncbi:MAG: acyltransferase family protein [Marinobacter adhaerens]
MTYRADIQLIRGVSVLMVVLFHLDFNWFRNGFLGVDVFFVLSGYLMAQLFRSGTALDFYVRRLKRLLPAYIVTVGVTTFFVGIIAVPVDFNQRLDILLFDLVGASNIGFWLHNSYFDSTAFKPLLNLWSLGVELQYYLLVPFLLPLLYKRRSLLIVVFLGSMCAAFYVSTISPKTSFFMLPFRVWEFLIGAFAAWYSSSSIARDRNFGMSTVLVLGLCLVLFYPLEKGSLSVTFGHPGLASLVISIIVGAILFKPLHCAFSDQNLLGASFVFLGKYSYSIYLVHFPIIVLVNYEPFGGTILKVESGSDLLFILFLIVVATAAMYHGIESIRTRRDFSKWILGLCLLCSIFSFAGVFINKLRFSSEQVSIFDAWSDRDSYRCGKVFRLLNPAESVCVISESGTDDSVFLIGNSHADSIKNSFSEKMYERGISTFFYVPNNPLMSSSLDSEVVLNDVKRIGVDAVVLHYSLSFFENELYREHARQLLETLRMGGVSVYLIAPVPTYDYHVPKRLYERTLDPSIHIRSQTISDYFIVNSAFFKFVESHEIEPSQVYFTHKLLCSGGECAIEENSKPLYFDNGHLTLTGAEVLAPLFESLALQIKK